MSRRITYRLEPDSTVHFLRVVLKFGHTVPLIWTTVCQVQLRSNYAVIEDDPAIAVTCIDCLARRTDE